MAAKIEQQIPGAKVELIRGKGGNFIVVADGKTLWHKRQMGDEFPDEPALLAQLKGA